MIELLAIGIAVALGWGIAHGLRGHMEAEPGAKSAAPSPSTVSLPAPGLPPAVRSCEASFEDLPTSADPATDVRGSIKALYASASTLDNAVKLESAATTLDDVGYHEQAQCLRTQAAAMRKASALFPTDTSGATGATSGGTGPGSGSPYAESVYTSTKGADPRIVFPTGG